MSLISLVCLLALSSSAFGRSMYSSVSSRSLASPKYGMSAQLQQDSQPINLQQQQLSTGYGSSYGAQTPKVFDSVSTQSYGQNKQSFGAMPRFAQFDQQQTIAQQPQAPTLPLTEADILCKGQRPETIIPLGQGERWIVCLDESKGIEQSCPKGLIYRAETLRCERKFSPVDACASQPCLYGGQCVQTEHSFQCQCTPGYDGKTCELDSRVCQTQQPCGQSLEAKCQSFHVGAALSHMCIVQDGAAYGLTAQQTHQNPCRGIDGPQPLAFSDKGFVFCDGESMFVQSCPGGTIWNDSEKSCTWPDMQIVPELRQLDQQIRGFSQSSVIQRPLMMNQQTFGAQLPRFQQQQKFDQVMTQQPQKFETESYGTQIQVPQFQQQQQQQPKFDQIMTQQPQRFEQLSVQKPQRFEQLSVQQPQRFEQLSVQQPQRFEQLSVQQPQRFEQLSVQKPQRLETESYGTQIQVPRFQQQQQQQQPKFDQIMTQQTRPQVFQQQTDLSSFGVQKQQENIPSQYSSGY